MDMSICKINVLVASYVLVGSVMFWVFFYSNIYYIYEVLGCFFFALFGLVFCDFFL